MATGQGGIRLSVDPWVRRRSGGGTLEISRRSLVQRLDRRGVLLSAALAGLILIVVLLYLAQANRLTTAGYEVSRMQERRALLERQNRQLKLQIARLTELSVIRSRAEEMGLQPATDYGHVVVRTAARPEVRPRSVLAPVPQAPRPAPGTVESAEELSGWWQRELLRLQLWLEAGLALGQEDGARK